MGYVFILTISTERGVAEVATLGWGCVHLEYGIFSLIQTFKNKGFPLS